MNNEVIHDDEKKDAPAAEEKKAQNVHDELDPVSIKDVEVEVPCEVTKVATSLTYGQKLYIEKCFKAMRAEVETGVNNALTTLRLRVATTFEESGAANGQWQKDLGRSMDQTFQKIDKKFSGLYSTLIHEFLVKLEQRVLNTEMYTKALIEKTAETVAAHEEHHAALYQTVLSQENMLKALIPMVAELSRDPEGFKAKLAEAAQSPKVEPSYDAKTWRDSYMDRVDAEARAFAERAAAAQIAPAPQGEQKATEQPTDAAAPVKDAQSDQAQAPKEEMKADVAVQAEDQAGTPSS